MYTKIYVSKLDAIEFCAPAQDPTTPFPVSQLLLAAFVSALPDFIGRASRAWSLESRATLHRIPNFFSTKTIGTVRLQSPAKKVKHQPTPRRSIRICSSASAAADIKQRTMLLDACAVAGARGWRSTSKVPHIYDALIGWPAKAVDPEEDIKLDYV